MRAKAIAALTSMAIVGCASVTPNRDALPLDARDRSIPEMFKPQIDIGIGDASVEYIEVVGGDEFLLKDMIHSDPLPDFQVRAFSYSNAGVYDVITTLLSHSNQDISLTIDPGVLRSGSAKKLVSGHNIKGSFSKVLADLSAHAGFYYRYRDGVLTITAEKQYVTTLPPVPELLESTPAVLRSLGANDALVDRASRMITFRADRNAYEKIEGYLEQIRSTRSLITYDCYIWEVVLNDRSQMGINWRNFPSGLASQASNSGIAFNQASNSGATSASINLTNALSGNGGTGIGLTFKGSRIALNAMLDFLQTQGTVNNVSQPKISLLSGSTAQFRNGASIQYISRVSPGVFSNGVWTAGSAETAVLRTGVTMTISGDISDGTVFSDISLKLEDLVRMDTQQVAISQGVATTISLPTSADREVNARVRARPGDAIIVGGINLQNASNQFSGIGPVPTSSSKNAQRSELVVVLIPRVTQFKRRNQGEI